MNLRIAMVSPFPFGIVLRGEDNYGRAGVNLLYSSLPIVRSPRTTSRILRATPSPLLPANFHLEPASPKPRRNGNQVVEQRQVQPLFLVASLSIGRV